MQSDSADYKYVTIAEKLERYSPSPSACCIYKVHNQLRSVNSEAYEPRIIAIGPYHRSKDNFKMMEEHKLRYLHFRLQQKNENVEKYLIAMRELEPKARKFYAETLELKPDEMAEMMLLDGFFIIELFRKFNMEHVIEKNDIIFQMSWIVNSLQRDLMLFENQLPFFILCKLFDMIENPNNHSRFIYLAKCFFRDLFPGQGHESEYSAGDQSEKISHLLGLVHDNWLPTPVKKPITNRNVTENKEINVTENKKNVTKTVKRWGYIQCATQLQEAGIRFDKKDDQQSLFDINLNSKVLQIPTLRIEDRTESFFRNLVAYEQYGQNINRFGFVTDYLKFMDCLINSSNDVALLSRHEIIENLLGDDEVVSTIFNKITDFVTVPNCEHFRYAGICENVNIHCSKRRNRWIAIFKRSYLSNPWTVISLLAAFVLLALTITQTVYTIIG